MKNNENGRSMVEMLGVLAIIGVLSAGGLAGYSKAMFKHKLNTTMDQITMLVTNIRTMYGTQGNYAGLDGNKAYDLGIIPAVMAEDGRKTNDGVTTGGVSLTNPFKGSVSIAAVEIKTGDLASATTTDATKSTGFSVTYDGLPKEACIALSTADFGSGAGSGFIGAKITGKTQSGTYGSTTEGDAYTMAGKGSVPGAIDACSENTAITWFFY